MEAEKLAKCMEGALGLPVVPQSDCGLPPAWPFLAYSVQTGGTAPKGTVCRADGKWFWQARQNWSLTMCAAEAEQARAAAQKAVEWLLGGGGEALAGLGYAVEKVGDLQNRDSLLTAETECREGFELHLAYMVEAEKERAEGWIETASVEMTGQKERGQDV